MGQDKKKLTMEEREETLSKVEEMMAKGSQRPSGIAKELGISFDSAKNYIGAIQTRWRVSKSHEIDITRAELIEKLKEAEIELWKSLKGCTNDSARIGGINAITKIAEYRAWLSGITKILGSKDDK